MKQNISPLWSALRAYQTNKIIPFHTPGHKLHPGDFQQLEEALGTGFFALDPSDEIEDSSFNHDFELALQKAQELSAELFGAEDSLFLVNGTTGGLHYLLMPTTGSVLIPRFSHQAVYSALMLGQGQAVYLPAKYDQEWLVPLQPTVAEVEQKLADKPCQAIVITHPTYYGTVSDLAALTKLAHANEVLVFVDEAHGGHFLFSNELPLTGLDCGADAVVQSTHKTLGSFTQTSMLHSQNKMWFPKVVQARQVLQTTSPSMVFLAALDEVRRVLAEKGKLIVERSLELAYQLREQLQRIPRVELLPDYLQSDPTKVVFSLRNMGLSGIELESILREDYNIQVELSDYYSVLALISVGDTRENIDKIIMAVSHLVQRKGHLGKGGLPRYNLNVPALPPSRLTLRQAFFQAKEEIPLENAVGKISGSFLTPYPPGVPAIVPGEEFTPDIVEYLKWCLHINWSVRGFMAEQKVVVLKENHSSCRKTK